jgi:hypothetical protein
MRKSGVWLRVEKSLIAFGVLYQGKIDEFYSQEEVEFIKSDKSTNRLPISRDLDESWWISFSFCEEIILISFDDLFTLPLLPVDDADAKVNEILKVIFNAI